MFIRKFVLTVFFTLLLSGISFSQDFTITLYDTIKIGNPGQEMIFEVDVKNITAGDLAIFMVRTQNDLPANWQSALCFDICFASFLDSVATTPDFGSTPLASNETRRVALHIFADMVTPGTATVGIKFGSLRNPGLTIPVTFKAIVQASSAEKEAEAINDKLTLSVFPNPSASDVNGTQVYLSVPASCYGNLNIYNNRGETVAKLHQGFLERGNHTFMINTEQLAAGVYYCVFRSENNQKTVKALILK